ncbi:puromycin-sensitive aminopeptidase [Brachionus plicatilis]|uniref:Aminopeptidase n=1 Tax=Brachionus plicatilis TaxID=10195 RepID=A0A3M7S2X0_BRAPC|nr:puromycin-sensitive aminopeptidase [Brachionus plicatilis]
MSRIETDLRQFGRLKKNILPINYNLSILPNFDNFKFTGTVKIEINIIEETDVIEIHSLELKLTSVKILSQNEEFPCSTIIEAPNCESVDICFARKISKGISFLKINFEGILNENLTGFYKTKCLDNNGHELIAAVTQFEAAYARKAFPCFDEPSMKATFDICIIAERTKTVLSNMPLREIKPYEIDPKFSMFFFDRTVKMSTYLVAFIVGDYDYVEAMDELGTKIRVYTPKTKTEMGKFSLEIAVKAVPFFTKFFGIQYPLPKLDLVALNDVEIESLLLIDPKKFSVQTRSEVALVVAHEIAHQWFGNLVTMKWWTDLWLNEGFATWIEYLCIDFCFPNWNIWSLYATDHLYRAFNLDALKSSHPIEVDVGPPSEINQIFDSISYCKGSAILRMLNHYVGKDCFIKGLNNYLEKFKFSNATSDDLWDEIDLASKRSVKKMMQVWTKVQGYPVVYVSVKLGSNRETILSLSQKKFSANPEGSGDGQIWNIPISIVTRSSYPKIYTTLVLDKKENKVDLGEIPEQDWIKLNADNIGFFKVFYPHDMLQKFFAHSSDTSLLGSVLDRYGIINDAFSFVFSGELKASELLKMLKQFRFESDVHVWITIFKNLNFMIKCVLDQPYWDKFKDYIEDLLASLKKKIGFDLKQDEDDLQKFLKENILYMLAKIDDPDFKQFALNAFNERNNVPIPADLQKPIFTSVLRNGNTDIVNDLISLYKESSIPEEKEKIAILLGEVIAAESIELVLKFSISNLVTLEETVFILVSLGKNSTNKISLDLTWKFIKNNWDLFVERYADSVILGRLLKPIIECFSSESSLNDVKTFFLDNPCPQADQSIEQAIESIKSNIYFLSMQNKDLDTFFS